MLLPSNRTVRNLLAIFFGDIFGRLTSMASAIILARYLGPEDYGKYTFVVSFAYIFVILSEFGLNDLMVKDVAKDRSVAAQYLASSFIIKGFFSCLSIVGVILAVYFMGYPRDVLLCMVIFSFHIIFITLINSMLSIFKAYERMEYASLVMVLNGTVGVLFIVALVYFQGTLLEIILSKVLTFFVGFLFGFIILVTKFVKPNFSRWWTSLKTLLAKAFPFLAIGFIYTLYFKVDIILLSKLKGSVYVGWYAAAGNDLFFALFFIPSSITTVMFPIFSRQFVEAREEFRQSVNFTIKVVAILGIGVAAGSILLAPQIIHFVFGREYENSVSVLRIIGIGIPLVFLRDILSYGLTAAERIRTLIWVNVATLVLNVVLNVILIPLYAHVGAALSSVASLSFSLALNYHYLEGQIKGIEMMRNWVKPLVAAGIMAIFLLFFDKLNGGVNLFILIVLGGGVYLGCTFLMQTLNSREISYLKKAFTMKWSSKHLGGPSA